MKSANLNFHVNKKLYKKSQYLLLQIVTKSKNISNFPIWIFHVHVASCKNFSIRNILLRIYFLALLKFRIYCKVRVYAHLKGFGVRKWGLAGAGRDGKRKSERGKREEREKRENLHYVRYFRRKVSYMIRSKKVCTEMSQKLWIYYPYSSHVLTYVPAKRSIGVKTT